MTELAVGKGAVLGCKEELKHRPRVGKHSLRSGKAGAASRDPGLAKSPGATGFSDFEHPGTAGSQRRAENRIGDRPES